MNTCPNPVVPLTLTFLVGSKLEFSRVYDVSILHIDEAIDELLPGGYLEGINADGNKGVVIDCNGNSVGAYFYPVPDDVASWQANN